MQGQITDCGSYHELEAKGVEFKQFGLHRDGSGDASTHYDGTAAPDRWASALPLMTATACLPGAMCARSPGQN